MQMLCTVKITLNNVSTSLNASRQLLSLALPSAHFQSGKLMILATCCLATHAFKVDLAGNLQFCFLLSCFFNLGHLSVVGYGKLINYISFKHYNINVKYLFFMISCNLSTTFLVNFLVTYPSC